MFGQPSGPSSVHPLGVDELGRDILARIIYGARVSLEVAFISTGLAVFFGVIVGTLAGFLGGWLDTALSRIMDIVLAFPILLLAIGLSSACTLGNGCLGGLINPGRTTLIFVIALSSWPYIGRIIRGQVLSLREKEFVEAARSLGASNGRIMRREILPNLVAPIIVYTSLVLPTNILYEAALSFLGRRGAAADRELGPDDRHGGADLRLGLVVHAVPGHRAGRHRSRLQPRGRRAAGRPRPAQHQQVNSSTQTGGAQPAYASVKAKAGTRATRARRRARARRVRWQQQRQERRRWQHCQEERLERSDVCIRRGRRRQRQRSQGQQKGGTLKVVSAEGWQHLDPGQSYFQIDYLVMYAVHRPLYSFDPSSKLTPDLAAGPAADQPGRQDRHGQDQAQRHVLAAAVKRAVTSDDVKYAFERHFNPNVPNGYATSYYPIVGVRKSKGGPISGIETPDKTTIVFHLTKNFGATFAQALTLPGTAPVPKEVAGPMDKKTPTTYDSEVTKQAFSGPYMIPSYAPGRSLTLVRNPNWKADTDYRPAYADTIVWKAGGDANVLARQTLNSPDLLMADGPPAPVLKTAYQPEARTSCRSRRWASYYAALNTTRPPFDNVNLRQAPRSRSPIATPTCSPAAASWSARWPRTSSGRRSPASRRPAAPTASGSTS